MSNDNRTEWVFARFSAIFGARWTTPLDDELALDAAIEEWGKALAPLTEEQVRCGLEAVKADPGDWPPSIPGFLRMALAVPDEFVAVGNAIRFERDPLSIEIRRRAGGTHVVRNSPESVSRRLCEGAYRDVVRAFNERVLRGEPTEPLLVLENLQREAEGRARIETKDKGPAPMLTVIPKHLGGDGNVRNEG